MPEVTGTADTTVDVQQTDAFDLLLKPENQEAMRVIVEQLPKLATTLHLFGKMYDAVEEILSDGELIGAVENIVRDKADPVVTKYKETTEAFREAKERADQDTTQIGVFGILRLLKDPQLQHYLRLAQAFLEVQRAKA